MKLVRTILAIVISAGLALAPVQAAYAMRMVPMASMEIAADATPLTDQECFCCDVNVRCPVNMCATHCVQPAPVSDFTFGMALTRCALRGCVPYLHDGLNWQPPTPPPRA